MVEIGSVGPSPGGHWQAGAGAVDWAGVGTIDLPLMVLVANSACLNPVDLKLVRWTLFLETGMGI